MTVTLSILKLQAEDSDIEFIVEELRTNLMSLIIFISLIMCSTCFGGVRLQVVATTCKRTPPIIIRSKPQHTTKREQDNRCCNP